MCRAYVLIDVQAIWGAADSHNFSAQFMKHLGRYLVGRAMRRIDHNFHTLQGQI